LQISIQNLTFSYSSPDAKSPQVLKNINLNINNGEFLAIIGLSGSGKTTLIQHFTGLLEPDKGRVFIDNHDIWRKNANQDKVRRKIGLVFQFPETQLFAETVYDDIAFGPRNCKLDEDEIAGIVRKAMSDVDLDTKRYGQRFPYHLSDGEKRRVAIAGVLALQPECLVLDEPTAGLDLSGIKAVANILQQFHSQNKTVVVISHNLDFALSLVSRVVIMKKGAIIFDGQKQELLENPEILKHSGLPCPRIISLANLLRKKGLLKNGQLTSVREIIENLCLE
jgi:energy-coupling factor transport system ATP-binding protein